MIILRPKIEFRSPVQAECINPDNFQGKTPEEIGKLMIWEGNRKRNLSDLFMIREQRENQRDSTQIVVDGNVSRVRRLGAYMKSGTIKIRGDTGLHLGEEMEGGDIDVDGNVGGWAGSMMKGGTIRIKGDVGDHLGGPYRGSNKGMQRGKIEVHGNVGNEAGSYMRNGMIKIYGDAGQFTGLRMSNGTIYIQGNCSERAGGSMTGGKIIADGHVKAVLPTFTIESVRPKVKIEDGEVGKGPYYLFMGDLSENGRGRLYVHKEKNTHLSRYEDFL